MQTIRQRNTLHSAHTPNPRAVRNLHEVRDSDARHAWHMRAPRMLRDAGWTGMTREPRRGITAAGWFWAAYVAALVLLLVWVAA